jgi:hypothetical protein
MKRVFASLVFLLLFAAAPSLVAEDFQTMAIPDWVMPKINETHARFVAWRGDDEVVVFPVVSDIHSGIPEIIDPPNFSDPKMHILFAQRAATRFNADFLADLGDNGMDRDTHWAPATRERALVRMDSTVRIYRDFPLPVLFAMGNHDLGNATFTLPVKQFGETFNGMARKRGAKLVTGPNSDYGYYDIPNKKCRVFFLNSSEILPWGYKTSQLQFLADHLQVPKGYCVVVLQHYCIHPTIGAWLPSGPHVAPNQTLCCKILEAFAAGAKGEEKDVRWDFAGNRDTRLAGCITGDSHFDTEAVLNGVNHVITQSYGTIQPKNLPKEPVYLRFNRKTEMLVDVVAIKPDQGEMRFFRIGAGGADRDRKFTFATKP